MVLNLVLAASPVPGGGYISIFKVVVAVIILLIWTRMMTWADTDAPAAHLPRIKLNLGNIAGLIVSFALFFLLPSFWLGVPVLLLGAGVEAAVYLNIRKKMVGLRDLKKQWENWLASFSKKKVDTTAGEILLFDKAGKQLPVPDAAALTRPAYDAFQTALTDPLKKKADQVDLDGRGETGTAVKYMVDGVAYAGQAIDGVSGAGAIGLIKELSGLDVADRRKPQSGTMKINLNGQKHELKIQTAGSTAGEYVRVLVDPKNRHKLTVEQLGFSESQLAKVKESVKENSGVVLLSTPKGMGLTNLSYAVLRSHDAFLEHIQTLEREPEEDLEGITQTKLGMNAPPAEEYKQVDWIISQDPTAIFVNKLEDPRSAVDLINYAKNGKRVYVALRAASTFEALTQWRKIVGDDTLAVDVLKMVINGRVLRKLCNNCKVGYAPDPATLRKLGMNPEKVTQLFQARTSPQRDAKGNPVPCEFCQELRYSGRTGVFEIMTVDDDLRQAAAANKPIEPVFRKQRSRFLQEEALALVEKGDTSVQEVKRILRPDAAETAKTPAAAPTESLEAAAPAAVAAARRPSSTTGRK